MSLAFVVILFGSQKPGGRAKRGGISRTKNTAILRSRVIVLFLPRESQSPFRNFSSAGFAQDQFPVFNGILPAAGHSILDQSRTRTGDGILCPKRQEFSRHL